MKKFLIAVVGVVLVYFASLGCSFKGGGSGPDLISNKIVSVYDVNNKDYVFLGEKFFIVLDELAAPTGNMQARADAEIFGNLFGKKGCSIVLPEGIGIGEIKGEEFGDTKVHISFGIVVDKREATRDTIMRAENATHLVQGANGLLEPSDIFHGSNDVLRGEAYVHGYVYKSSPDLLEKAPKITPAFTLTLADFGLDRKALKEMPSRNKTIFEDAYLKHIAVQRR